MNIIQNIGNTGMIGQNASAIAVAMPCAIKMIVPIITSIIRTKPPTARETRLSTIARAHEPPSPTAICRYGAKSVFISSPIEKKSAVSLSFPINFPAKFFHPKAYHQLIISITTISLLYHIPIALAR